MRQLLAIMSVCLTAGLCFAGATLYVDDNAPNDPGPGDPLVSDPAEDGSEAHPFDAVQQAIDAAISGDEVIILPGTYTGEGNRDIDFKGKAITVRGTNPDDPNIVAATVIDCHGTQTDPHRGFYFHSGETTNSLLKGLTVANGCGLAEADVFGPNSGTYVVGGGILLRQSSPLIEGLLIQNCVAGRGAGLFATTSQVYLKGCEISTNSASESGGGLYVYEGNMVVDGCSILNNSATINAGGGNLQKTAISMKRCIISGNRSRVAGGFYIYESQIALESITVSANVADTSGGGIFLFLPFSQANLRKCLFSGNYSKSSGGAIEIQSGMANFSNCTIAGNRAAVLGGGIYAEAGEPFGSSIRLENSIVWGNRAARGNQIACETSDEGFSHGYGELWYSDIQGGMAGTFGWVRLKDGTIDADPLFAEPGRWDDGGTPTDWSDDTWIYGDYHLKSYAGRWDSAQEQWVMDSVHSPCIDAGDPLSDFSAEPAYNGGRVNMGAYGNSEYASKTPDCPARPVGDLDEDCKVTFADLALFAATWLDCNLDPPIACE